MFNILIVDDEELICRGLKSMIERNNIKEIKSVGFISNPSKVQEAVVELQPNIIITDIRMPEITGLDLIRNISKFSPNIKFVVLSGYDDFNYVKEAFKLGAQDYLLKPVSTDELTDILNKVMNTIKEEQQIKLNQQDRTHKYKEAILENKLNKIFMNSQPSEGNINVIFEELDISLPYPRFSVGALNTSNNITENKNLENIRRCLDEISEKVISKNELAVFFLDDLNNNLIFIFNHSSKVNSEQIAEYLYMLMNSLKNNMNLETIASISDTGYDIGSIISCHDQAMEALSYKIAYESYKVIKYSEVKDKAEIDEAYLRQIDKIKEYVLSYNTADVSNLIDKLFSKDSIRNLSIKSISRIYRKSVNRLYEAASESELNVFNDKDKPFNSFNSLSDLKIHLKTLIFEFIMRHKDQTSEKSISDLVKKYVNDNYSKDIDMAVVSNMVSLSYSHFSKIFKDETGMNFSDYLTKIRMEKALEMLSNPINKVNDISKGVGYNNPKHFTRAFKNHFGFSPSEYRLNIPKNNEL